MIKERTKNKIITCCGLIEAYLIYLAQGVTITEPSQYPSPFNHKALQSVYPEIRNSLGDVALWFIVGIIFLQIVFALLKTNDYKDWIAKMFRHIIDQDLGGQTYETRITLYIEKEGWRIMLRSLWYAVKQLVTEGKSWYFSTIPHPFKKYLVPYSRFSYPEKEKAYTYFRALTKDSDQTEGAVEKCYKTGKDVQFKTPFISNIKFTNKLMELSCEDKKKVLDYINITGIGYRRLRMLQRKANVIYAIPLRKDAHIWGVLVFDNNTEDTPIDLKDKMKNVIDNYQKIIQLTIEKI